MAEQSSPPRRRGPPTRMLIAVAIVLLAAAIVAWMVLRPHHERARLFTGYVTTDDLYLSSPIAGAVVQVDVVRGQRVAAGALLFRIDPAVLGARADEAGAKIGQSRSDLAAQEAQLARAIASAATARIEVRRTSDELARYQQAERDKPGSVSGLQLDQARAAADSARRQAEAARTDVAAGRARIAAGEAQLQGARAGLTEARTQVDQLAPRAPAPARVDNVMYQAGEWAAANAVIVSLAPDDQVKVRFYVPQSVVDAYRPGTLVPIACDGCAHGMTATVDYVSPRPEYTPPVIYSLATREKLVFLVEARPSAPRALTPGQPIDVTARPDGRPLGR